MYESKESKTAFAQFQLELETAPALVETGPGGRSVAEVLLAYLKFAERYYVDADGKPTAELVCMKAAVKPVKELYADIPATKFGPVALRAIRQSMINSGLCRGHVNHRVNRVKRVFRWAASEELVPVSTYEGLRTLAGLRRGRCGVREAEPVKPVADEVVKATLPHLPPAAPAHFHRR